MPKRPESHIVSDVALTRVAQICSACGWACEPVHKDYGEDLLVQTQLGGQIDSSRIWFQVKGTRNISRFRTNSGAYSLGVSLQHALKWVRSADLVVLVLWDTRANRALYALPTDHWHEFELLLSRGSARIPLAAGDVFDEKSALRIGWIARIRHYARLINDHNGTHDSFDLLDEEDTTAAVEASRSAIIVAFDFLRLVGVTNGKSVRKQFLTDVKKSSDIIASKTPNLSANDLIGQAKILAILRAVHVSTDGCPIPRALLKECSKALDLLLPT